MARLKSHLKNVNELGNLVKDTLNNQEYQFVEKQKFILAANFFQEKFYTQGLIIDENIYLTNDDFVVYNPSKKEKFIIQTSNRIINKKYPYKTIIILDIMVHKEETKIWLKEQEKTNDKLQVFENFLKFKAWATKNL